MTGVFWAIVAAMTVAAIAFVMRPLFRTPFALTSPFVVAAVIFPLFAIGAYAVVGTPAALTAEAGTRHSKSSTNAASRQRSSMSVGSVSSMLDGLKSRLEQNPEDAGGWLLLAQSYQHLGRPHEARTAYEHAKALGKTNPNLEASLPAPIGSQAPLLAESSGPAIRGRVVLAADLASEIKPGDTVFIFAKESRSHRMPVAALRRPASDLPIDFVLGNAQAMLAGTDLASYPQLVVMARISRTGMATESLKNLEAWSPPVAPDRGEHIELTITRTLESPADE